MYGGYVLCQLNRYTANIKTCRLFCYYADMQHSHVPIGMLHWWRLSICLIASMVIHLPSVGSLLSGCLMSASDLYGTLVLF